MWLRIWLLILETGVLHGDRELDTKWRAKGTVSLLAKVSNHLPISSTLGPGSFLAPSPWATCLSQAAHARGSSDSQSLGQLGMLAQDVTLRIPPIYANAAVQWFGRFSQSSLCPLSPKPCPAQPGGGGV